MIEKLESILYQKKFRGIAEKDIELEGVKELYGKPVAFLGVSPFFMS
ncbi:MAG: hypothetical protein ACP5MV_01565 [Candidatus Parvarchaeum sp.]